jgi:predicted Rossmann-fold nucleotide-binding protein
MHFLLRARALVAFPGGYGTLDEVFEALNLVATGTIPPMPILLVGQDYWTRVVNLDYLIEQGFADPLDRTLLQIVETGAEAARFILEHCR